MNAVGPGEGTPVPGSLLSRLQLQRAERRSNWRLGRVAGQVARVARPRPGHPVVAFFNASTRLTGMSLNAAFSFLAASGLKLAGLPVVHFACRSGMNPCVLGTNRDDYSQPPPCKGCIAQAQLAFANAPVVWFPYRQDPLLEKQIRDLDLDQLGAFEYRLPELDGNARAIPLGSLVMPSLRWALRMHNLPDDEPTRFLLRRYLLSARSVAGEFTRFLDQAEPSTAVIFNGIMYPEAAARWVAQQRGVRVVTHEVGFKPFSAFFTDGQATAYPIHIPGDFELTPEQDARLDAYLGERFQGEFTMAGIRFWPQMDRLDEDFLRRAGEFAQLVPVFTNVVYDTSQVHANTVFPHMFAWLDLVLELVLTHPETFFVLRAHPDEMRPGTGKQSRESVKAWAERNRVLDLPNVVFIDSQEYLSSYELVQQAKFVMVYNSSIGLEAALMGKPVLCGGKARFTQYPTVFFPDTAEAYRCQAEQFLLPDRPVPIPPEFIRNARRFLYYQLFRASLPFDDFLELHPRPGFVQLRPFSQERLAPERSRTIRTLVDGILHGKPFLLPEEEAHG
jgi:hypothetical protein